MSNSAQVHWQKITFKHLGKQGVSDLDYNFINGRFDPLGVIDNIDWLRTSPDKSDFENNAGRNGQFIPNENYYEHVNDEDIPL